MGGQVVSTGSDNISGFSWDDGTVWGSYESWGIWVSSISVSSISSIGSVVSSPGSVVKTSISVVETSISSVWVSWESLGGEVSGFSSSYFWGLSWSYGTIWVGDELGAGGSGGCEESQEFHVCC